MTLLYDSQAPGAGTHVLAIGVGAYPHLLNGTKALANRPLGLKQLQSPPESLKALLDWFLKGIATAGPAAFLNADAPLATIEALASSAAPTAIAMPAGPVTLDPATRDNIQTAFEAWLQRLRGNADNVGIFYFCGHGIMVSDHYLLAEDFGRSNAQPWTHAFDITNTIRAVEREVSGSLFFLLDACREVSRDVATTLGANPQALFGADLSKKVSRRSMTSISATGEGELAFAPPGGKVSRFTSALLSALSGYSGIKAAGAATWDVDGESIATATRKLLDFDSMDEDAKPAARQVSEQLIRGTPVPLLRLPAPPLVKVALDLTPSQRRALYELYLLSAKGKRDRQLQQDQIFRIEVTRGFYEIGAADPAGQLAPMVLHEEELIPPTYHHRFTAQP